MIFSPFLTVFRNIDVYLPERIQLVNFLGNSRERLRIECSAEYYRKQCRHDDNGVLLMGGMHLEAPQVFILRIVVYP